MDGPPTSADGRRPALPRRGADDATAPPPPPAGRRAAAPATTSSRGRTAASLVFELPRRACAWSRSSPGPEGPGNGIVVGRGIRKKKKKKKMCMQPGAPEHHGRKRAASARGQQPFLPLRPGPLPLLLIARPVRAYLPCPRMLRTCVCTRRRRGQGSRRARRPGTANSTGGAAPCGAARHAVTSPAKHALSANARSRDEGPAPSLWRRRPAGIAQTGLAPGRLA